MFKIQSTLKTNFLIFMALMRKDLHLLTRNWFSLLLDCAAPLAAQIITFGFLFPILGMHTSLIAPVYLGSMLGLFLQLGFSHVIRVGFDLSDSRFIDYQLTLALPKQWLLAQHIIYFMCELLLTMIPLFTIGVLILRDHFTIAAINWLAVLVILILICLFFATFFTALSYAAPFKWNLDNAWPRILIPFFTFSSAITVWKEVAAFSPTVAYIMLASPITYVAEGMRSALLPGTDYYIPLVYCAAALIVFSAASSVLLWYGIKKRLDPV